MLINVYAKVFAYFPFWLTPHINGHNNMDNTIFFITLSHMNKWTDTGQIHTHTHTHPSQMDAQSVLLIAILYALYTVIFTLLEAYSFSNEKIPSYLRHMAQS